MQILYYFLIGAILDILGTLDTMAVLKHKPVMSGIVSFIGTLIGTLIIVDFAQNEDLLMTILYVSAYGIGGSVGGSSMIYLDIKNRKKKRQKGGKNEKDKGIPLQ